MLAIQDYGSSDENSDGETTKPLAENNENTFGKLTTSSLQICSAPEVVPTVSNSTIKMYIL